MGNSRIDCKFVSKDVRKGSIARLDGDICINTENGNIHNCYLQIIYFILKKVCRLTMQSCQLFLIKLACLNASDIKLENLIKKSKSSSSLMCCWLYIAYNISSSIMLLVTTNIIIVP